jgi:hypothetical protein
VGLELLDKSDRELLQHILGSGVGSQQAENARAVLQQRSAEAQAGTAEDDRHSAHFVWRALKWKSLRKVGPGFCVVMREFL